MRALEHAASIEVARRARAVHLLADPAPPGGTVRSGSRSATMRVVTPSPTDPAHEDNWLGGFYELTIKLGDPDDARLDAALAALWRAAPLAAPYRRVADDSSEVSARSLLAGHLHSVATIPDLGRPCVS